MNPIEKIAWKIINHYDVALAKFNKNELPLGMLRHREDPRDLMFGGFQFPDFRKQPKPKYNGLGIPLRWVFNQQPFNMCVQASNIMAASYQEGERYSCRAYSQIARKRGEITGNGFSFPRSPLNISVQIGRLPYSLLPDETFGLSWNEYSEYKITDEMLSVMATKKAPNYQKVANAFDAVELLERGYCLILALKWYKPMNRPLQPEYLLIFGGVLQGAHAIFVFDYVASDNQLIKYTNPETFGEYYGDRGVAYIKDIFNKDCYDVYFMEKIEGRTDAERVGGLYDGLCIKSHNDSTIYLVQNNEKRPFEMSWPNYCEYVELYYKRKGEEFYTIPDWKIEALPTGSPIV